MNKKCKTIYIAFGANLSNPNVTFRAAIDALKEEGVSVVSFSKLWQSPAWPSGSGQPDYTNACACVSFDGSARELLAILHRVEAQFGRSRTVKNAARALDLDLLDFAGEVLRAEDIVIPHPRMIERGFVLLPLSQIAPNWEDPISGQTIWDLIAGLPSKDVLEMSCSGGLD